MTDITQLDPRTLMAFVAIFEESSVTAAANRLNMTQQGMSGTLARLRNVFGEPLFVRVPHGVSPTPYADTLYPRVLAAIESVKGLLEPADFNPGQLEATVRIATSDYALSVMVRPLFQRLRMLAPHLKLAILPLQVDQLTSQMRTGEVDLALTVPEFLPNNLYSMKLFSDHYKCAFRKGHALATKRLTTDAFCKVEHLLVAPNGTNMESDTDKVLAQSGRARTVGLAVPSFLVAEPILVATDLLGILPSRLLGGSSESLFVTDPPIDIPSFEIVCAWSERLRADPANIWIRQILQTLISEPEDDNDVWPSTNRLLANT